MNKKTYKIPNISCMHCVNTIEMELGFLEGVSSVKADKDSREAVVKFQDPATDEKIRSVLNEINYPAEMD